MKDTESLWPNDFPFEELAQKEHPVHILYQAGEELYKKTLISYCIKRTVNTTLNEITLDLNLATANFPLFGLGVGLDKKYPVMFRDYTLAEKCTIHNKEELKQHLRQYFKSEKVMNIIVNLMHCLKDYY